MEDVRENARKRFRTEPIFGEVMLKSDVVAVDRQKSGIEALEGWKKEEKRFATVTQRAGADMFRGTRLIYTPRADNSERVNEVDR